MRRVIERLVVTCGLSLVALPAHADLTTPYAGARSLSMGGASRAMGLSNDSLMVNPAAISATKRYGAQLTHVTGTDHLHRILGSTVDSQTGPISAGVSYMRTWGNPSDVHPRLSEVHLALAYSPLPFFTIGVGAQNASGSYHQHGEKVTTNAFNSTVGALLHLGDIIGVGISWENYIAAPNTPLLPRVLGLGIGLNFSLVRAAADMRLFPAKHGAYRRDIGAGLEGVIARLFVVRGGYRAALGQRDAAEKRPQWATFGVGLAFGQLGIDAGFELPLHHNQWRLGTGFSWLM